jgi:Flp pilus assembly protein TadG
VSAIPGSPRSERRGRGRGQTLVEFAIVLPIILLVLIGMVDMGRAVFVYNTLAQSARQAARLAIVNQNVDDVKDQAMASAPTLGMSAANVDVCFKTTFTSQTNCANPAADNCPQSSRVIGCLALVSTHVNYTPMTPFINTIFPSISLSSVSVGTIEYVCPEGTATECT